MAVDPSVQGGPQPRPTILMHMLSSEDDVQAEGHLEGEVEAPLVAQAAPPLRDRAYPRIVGDPRLEILEEGLLETVHGLDRSYHLATPTDDCDPAASAPDFAALTEALRSHGLTPVAPGDPAALEAYARFRAATDPYVCAYAENQGYALDEVYGLYSRWARDAALVPVPEEEAA